MSKIFKVTRSLYKDNIISVKEYSSKETSKSYVFDGIRLNKSKILQPEFHLNSTRWIAIYCYCLESDLETAKTILNKMLLEKIEEFKKDIQSFEKLLETAPLEEIRVIDTAL